MSNSKIGYGATRGSIVWGALALVLSCVACGKGEPSEEGVDSVRAGLTQADEVAIVLPAGAVLGQMALAATSTLTVADGVLVPNTGGMGALTNTGNALTDIGADAVVGAVRSVGNVSLRSRATVNGPLYTAGTTIRQTGVTVTGGTTEHAVLSPTLRYGFRPPVLSGTTNINLEPALQMTLTPGNYGALNVKGRSVASLSSGTYTFSGGSSVEADATLNVDARAGTVLVYIGNSFSFKGKLALQGDASNVLFVALGNTTVDVLGSFQGTLFVPNATLHLGTTAAGHTGSFFGKSVTVDARTSIVTRPFAHWEQLISPVPSVRCVTRFDDTHWSALFGYTNPLPVAVNVPVGADNALSGVTGGAPVTTFAPGAHPIAFSAPFAGGPAVWSLRGNPVTANTQTPRCTENDYTPSASLPRTPGIIEPDPPSMPSMAALAALQPATLTGNVTLVQWPNAALLSPLPLSSFPSVPVTMPRSALSSFHSNAVFPQQNAVIALDENVGTITFIDLSYVPLLCASFKAQYVDAGGPGAEDFGAQKGVQTLPAAFARATLSIGANTAAWAGKLDQDGCIPTSGLGSPINTSALIVPDNTPIALTVESRFAVGDTEQVTWEVFFATDGLTQNAPDSDFNVQGQFDVSKLKAGTEKFPIPVDISGWGIVSTASGNVRIPPRRTDVSTVQEDEVTRVSAVVAQMLRQPDMGMAPGKYQAVANDGCPSIHLKTDSCFSPSDNILFIGPGNGLAAPDSEWKYVIAHEAGHFVQQMSMGSLNPTYTFCPASNPNCDLRDPAQALNDPEQTPALCKCDQVTVANQLHCLQSLERSQDAQIEGWAQFYASKTWNTQDESSCTFQYYKEFLDVSCPAGAQCTPKAGGTSIFPPLARTCKDAVKWRNRNCAVQNFGTEFDWMGFLWNANTASDQKASMNDLYAAYRHACGDQSCGAANAVDWQQFSSAASATLGVTSAKFSHFASTGDAFGVSDVTAP